MTIKSSTLRKIDDLAGFLAVFGGPVDFVVAGLWALARMTGLVRGDGRVSEADAVELRAERILAECRAMRRAR